MFVRVNHEADRDDNPAGEDESQVNDDTKERGHIQHVHELVTDCTNKNSRENRMATKTYGQVNPQVERVRCVEVWATS